MERILNELYELLILQYFHSNLWRAKTTTFSSRCNSWRGHMENILFNSLYTVSWVSGVPTGLLKTCLWVRHSEFCKLCCHKLANLCKDTKFAHPPMRRLVFPTPGKTGPHFLLIIKLGRLLSGVFKFLLTVCGNCLPQKKSKRIEVPTPYGPPESQRHDIMLPSLFVSLLLYFSLGGASFLTAPSESQARNWRCKSMRWVG